jgi:hypothetical protein
MLSAKVARATHGGRHRMRRVWVISAAFVVLSLMPACSAPRTAYACVIDASSSVDVVEVWDCNREIMVRVVKGKKFTLREFSRASEFFEALTGVPADVRVGSDGKLPGPDLADDLAHWDAWYAENGPYLVWDPDRRRIANPGSDP